MDVIGSLNGEVLRLRSLRIYMIITRTIADIPSGLKNDRLKLILQRILALKGHKNTLHKRLHKRWPVWCNQCSQLSDEQKCHRIVPMV